MPTAAPAARVEQLRTRGLVGLSRKRVCLYVNVGSLPAYFWEMVVLTNICPTVYFQGGENHPTEKEILTRDPPNTC